MKAEAASFKILSVETRIKVIELLKAGPLSVNAMAEALGVSQPAISQHLRVLKQSGLVVDERKGYHIFYSLNRNELERCQQELIRVCTCGCEGDKSGQLIETKEMLMEYKKQLEKEIKETEERIKEYEKKDDR